MFAYILKMTLNLVGTKTVLKPYWTFLKLFFEFYICINQYKFLFYTLIFVKY